MDTTLHNLPDDILRKVFLCVGDFSNYKSACLETIPLINKHIHDWFQHDPVFIADFFINSVGRTAAIVIASTKGYYHVVDVLYKKYGNSDVYTEYAESKQTEKYKRIVYFICMTYGVNVYVLNDHLALILAAKNGHECVVDLLCGKYGVNVHDCNEMALCWAASCGKKRVVDILCGKYNSDVHIKNDDPLYKAAKYGHERVVDMLCGKYNADVHVGNDIPLHIAASYGHERVVDLLCGKYDANVHASNDSALRWAVYFGHTHVVDLLCIKYGANVHIFDNYHYQRKTVIFGKKHMIDILCEKYGVYRRPLLYWWIWITRFSQW